uniref:Uncharacterized protein n=1 Tax=Anguilla anguilla TaxID=7936 RepID=A0A0E9PB88_ANGAN
MSKLRCLFKWCHVSGIHRQRDP